MQSALRRSVRPVPLALAALALLMLAFLGGCASGPSAHSGHTWLSSDRDGPEANPPPDLARVPDAEPKLEPIRIGGPNKPYDVLGHSYVPITQDAPFTERGLASWYGRKFNGKRTSSGELYDMYGMTAAHPTLPIPSYARIRNPANGREVVVRINDRGPFHSSRIVDLSYTAALKLDLLRGVAPVELQRITFDDIRTGAWRRSGGDTVTAAAPLLPSPVTPVPTAVVTVPTAIVASVGATPTDQNSAPATESPAPEVPAPGPDSTLPTPSASPSLPVTDAPVARAYTAPARGYWVQLGAFRAREGAETFMQRVSTEMDWLSPLLAVFSDAAMYRLQAGPYPSRDEARDVAERVRDGLKLVPVIVERR
jgi:rare lipoprotein A